jgi:hypothetical protein
MSDYLIALAHCNPGTRVACRAGKPGCNKAHFAIARRPEGAARRETRHQTIAAGLRVYQFTAANLQGAAGTAVFLDQVAATGGTPPRHPMR